MLGVGEDQSNPQRASISNGLDDGVDGLSLPFLEESLRVRHVGDGSLDFLTSPETEGRALSGGLESFESCFSNGLGSLFVGRGSLSDFGPSGFDDEGGDVSGRGGLKGNEGGRGGGDGRKVSSCANEMEVEGRRGPSRWR